MTFHPLPAALQASPLEFRLRYYTHAAIFAIGFWSPWDHLFTAGMSAPRQTAWIALADQAFRAGLLSFGNATAAVLILGILAASGAAALRTWASAYLGASIVQDGTMQAASLAADGPYRHLRNPLYVGTALHAVALALLMPATGAIFTVVATVIVQLRLIAGEEAFLTSERGAAYRAFCERVPRILPSIAPRIPAAGARPHWLAAVLGESYMIGVALVLATLGWRYNGLLLMEGVVVAFGISLVARAMLPPAAAPASEAQKPAADAGV